ncbi:MAG: citrate transporter [Lachnospiraceae bacterium]|nr:citrate transporter [Lachnospiraceae bacterium]
MISIYENAFSRVKSFVRKNIVLVIATVCALITSFIIKPDKEYLSYFDVKTLMCLFCVLAVVCALKNINFFLILAHKIVRLFKNTRAGIIALVYITFIGSMLIANDMALLTFLPLGYLVLSTTGKEKYMAFTFIMQNIAANLGGMLTPFGNPQNLYLYTKFEIANLEFIQIMIIPFLIAIFMITTLCFIVVKPEPFEIESEKISIDKKKGVLYVVLFALAIAIVFRGINYWWGLIIPAVLLIVDRKALKMVDYPLLLTFVAFFVFSGNMSRIDAVRDLFSMLLGKSTLIFSVLSCQVISNVPTAILLSQFTGNYHELLIGVNIGGVGTIIASLASLITLREFQKHYPKKIKSYFVEFSGINFAFLFILTLSALFY